MSPPRKRGVPAPAALSNVPDVARVAEAIKGPGIDTRRWLEAGTVGIQLEDGTFLTNGPAMLTAFFAGPKGLVVSVRLEPTDIIVQARVAWQGGRAGSVLFPVRAGDEVVVAIPGGDLKSPDIAVVGSLTNMTAPIPTDWNNDRVLWELAVPFQVRAPAVSIESPNLLLNGRKVSPSPEDL